LTSIAESHPHMLGVVNLRGQVIPVIDLPAVVGCNATKGLNILLITEFARTTQAFAVESVDEIVRLEWKDVLSAEGTAAGAYVTSIARIDGNVQDTRLAQVLDVETILRDMTPSKGPDIDPETIGPNLPMKQGSVILAADDSHIARTLIEQSLQALGAPYIMTKSGKEAWEKLLDISDQVKKEGVTLSDKVALVLSDLEMPEMDGFTLTRNIKQDPRFQGLPVVIHSSLSGSTNESHVKSVGADAYVAKFLAEDLASTIRRVISKAPA
jgi:two-component system chemotaxis response regulator CheV